MQAVHYTTSLNTGLGWAAGSSFDFGLSFTQSYMQTWIAGSNFNQHTFANASDYAGIYDQYRIVKVKLDMLVDANVGTYSTSSQSIPVIYSVIDYDDNNVMGSIDAALAYSSYKSHQFGFKSKQSRYLNKPTITINSLNTAGGANYGTLAVSPWLNCDDVTIDHKGFKFWYDPVSSTGNNTIAYITFIGTVFIEYKNIK